MDGLTHAEFQLWRTPENEERFWSKIRKQRGEDSCWLWEAGRFSTGYGQVRIDSRNTRSHRIAYWLTHPDIDISGLVIRHGVCRNPLCCRPDHLKSGSQAENLWDIVFHRECDKAKELAAIERYLEHPYLGYFTM